MPDIESNSSNSSSLSSSLSEKSIVNNITYNNNYSSEEYILKPFDTDKMYANSVFAISGPRNTGKTTLLINLLYVFHLEYDAIVLMTPTQETIDDFKQFVPTSMIYNYWNENKAIEIINFLRKATQSDDPHTFKVALIIDDLMATPEVMKSNVISDIFKNGRHVGIGVFVLCQGHTDIPSKFRSNIDFVFQLRNSVFNQLKFIFNNYFSVIGTEKTFMNIMTNVIKGKGHALVYDRTLTVDKWTDCVFSFKSVKISSIPPFFLGHRDYWILHSIYAIDITEYNKVPGSELFKKIQNNKLFNHDEMVNYDDKMSKTATTSNSKNTSKNKKKNRIIPLNMQYNNKNANNILVMDVSAALPKKQVKKPKE